MNNIVDRAIKQAQEEDSIKNNMTSKPVRQKKKARKVKLLDVGTIVEIYGNGQAYEMEFVDNKGRTIELVTLGRQPQIRPCEKEVKRYRVSY